MAQFREIFRGFLGTRVADEAMGSNFIEYVDFEREWLRSYVEDGFFNRLFLELLQDVLNGINDDPEGYLRGVLKFMDQVSDRSLLPDEGPKRLFPSESSPVYVARLVVSEPERGVGFNIVFPPTDPAYSEVSDELYVRSCHRLGLKEHFMPFGVLWSDAYYFRGAAYLRGDVEGEITDSGYEVFEDWEQTWAILHTNRAVFFRLNPPYFPKDSKEIIDKIAKTRGK